MENILNQIFNAVCFGIGYAIGLVQVVYANLSIEIQKAYLCLQILANGYGITL